MATTAHQPNSKLRGKKGRAISKRANAVRKLLPLYEQIVLSVGYERRSPEELVELLLEHDVHKLIDVREYPASRRKGFSKTALSSALSDAGIDYCHVRAAGNPHRKEAHDLARCLRLYGTYLRKTPHALENVVSELGGGNVAFLCYERRHDACHRSVLIERLQRRDSKINVILAE